jgi:hypothetical protein
MSDVTGRDGLIIAKALAYAIEAISALPPWRQEASDMSDMKRLLDAIVTSNAELERLLATVRRRLRPEFPFWRPDSERPASADLRP